MTDWAELERLAREVIVWGILAELDQRGIRSSSTVLAASFLEGLRRQGKLRGERYGLNQDESGFMVAHAIELLRAEARRLREAEGG